MSTYAQRPVDTQLTQGQRYQIYALLKMGHNRTEIASVLGVHKSTVSRELDRNRGQRGYRPKQAHQLALSRRGKPKRLIQPETWVMIEGKICRDWSPEQVSAWLKDRMNIQVSLEWIYQYILADTQCPADKQAGGSLYRHLRCQKKRRKRYGSYNRRGRIANRVSIEQRPAIVEQRQRLGDWEVDTIIGKGHQQAIVTLTERKSRLTWIHKVERRTAQAVQEAIANLLKPCKGLVHTLTTDNGKEFTGHQEIAEKLNADFYLAHHFAA